MTERTHSYYCICERFYIIHRKQTNWKKLAGADL
jgi:hypothetical protein